MENVNVGTPITTAPKPIAAPRAVAPRESVSIPVSKEVGTIKADKVVDDISPVRGTKIELSDSVIRSAKEEGVDRTLEKLRDRDFNELSREQVSQGDGKALQLRTESLDMQEKISQVIERKGEMRPEEVSQMAIVAVYDMVQVLKMMLEKEDERSDPDKESLVVVLMQLMAKLISNMLTEQPQTDDVEEAA